MNQVSIFDLLDDAPVQDVPAPAGLSEEDLAWARESRKVANYVKLGWHRGGEGRQTVFSSKDDSIAAGERALQQETIFLIPVPLPEAWIKDPHLHWKAKEYERRELTALGFHVDGDRWGTEEGKTEQFKVKHA